MEKTIYIVMCCYEGNQEEAFPLSTWDEYELASQEVERLEDLRDKYNETKEAIDGKDFSFLHDKLFFVSGEVPHNKPYQG